MPSHPPIITCLHGGNWHGRWRQGLHCQTRRLLYNDRSRARARRTANDRAGHPGDLHRLRLTLVLPQHRACWKTARDIRGRDRIGAFPAASGDACRGPLDGRGLCRARRRSRGDVPAHEGADRSAEGGCLTGGTTHATTAASPRSWASGRTPARRLGDPTTHSLQGLFRRGAQHRRPRYPGRDRAIGRAAGGGGAPVPRSAASRTRSTPPKLSPTPASPGSRPLSPRAMASSAPFPTRS